MTIQSFLVRDDGFLPKERYISAEFADLEFERLWPRVWQIAGREEELADAGDFLEYSIGDDSIVVVRNGSGELAAFYNACRHRGTRLTEGCGAFENREIRCPYHAWIYDLDGRLVHVPDAEEFPNLPADLGLRPVRVDRWGGFVFVNMDLDAEPLLEFLDPLPALLAPYRFDELRFRTYRSTVIHANWKAVVDAFNESYHVQRLHRQILPWTDDVGIAYEQFDRHAHYGRLPGARRELRPSPRLGLTADDYDEGEILGALVAGLGGAFLGEEREAVAELRASGPPEGATLLGAYQERRMTLLAERGFDVGGFTPDVMTSAEDVFCFPNLVGPVYPGSALLFRVRPNGRDPDSAIKDTWVLEWPRPGSPWKMQERRFYPDWHERKWGEITEQDYTNLANVQRGMHSRGFDGSRLASKQESNVLHMHRVLDRYLTR